MNPSIFKLKQIGSGNLYIMPCPRSQVLAEDLAYYLNLGVDTIVCLLEKPEMIARGLALEEKICRELNINFLHFPIPDRAIPNNLSAFRQLVDKLELELKQGRHVAIHCYAGIGRTGILAGSLLIREGMQPQAAIELMSETRGKNMPQTQVQYEFLVDNDEQHALVDHDSMNTPARPWWQRLISWSPAA
ncbi:dual specificity protein phosphatase family protein [uncultured Thiothrix sp.]|uniref:phosphatase domain-containing putative toxin n=1 Tax=uncultured Thiothrix sp. TaxID=223185 RepID=UPI00262936EB|nr:dual specificity protein phosphatase family protein [uncultured Thiothrix sp.]